MSQRPMAIGLLLCEQLIVEEDTKNVTLVNSFSTLTATEFPWTAPPFTVATWLTDGAGDLTFQVVVERVNTLEPLFEKEVRGRLASPLQQFRLFLRLRSLTFPVPGVYRVALLADGEIIAQRKLVLITKEISHE